jgi:hypothetical protein
MKRKTKPQQKLQGTEGRKPLSLHPLSFDEAVTDILKAKPEAKRQETEKKRRILGDTRP